MVSYCVYHSTSNQKWIPNISKSCFTNCWNWWVIFKYAPRHAVCACVILLKNPLPGYRSVARSVMALGQHPLCDLKIRPVKPGPGSWWIKWWLNSLWVKCSSKIPYQCHGSNLDEIGTGWTGWPHPHPLSKLNCSCYHCPSHDFGSPDAKMFAQLQYAAWAPTPMPLPGRVANWGTLHGWKKNWFIDDFPH